VPGEAGDRGGTVCDPGAAHQFFPTWPRSSAPRPNELFTFCRRKMPILCAKHSCSRANGRLIFRAIDGW